MDLYFSKKRFNISFSLEAAHGSGCTQQLGSGYHPTLAGASGGNMRIMRK